MALIIRDALAEEREQIRSLLLEAYGQYADHLPASRWVPYRDSIAASVEGEGPAARIVAVRGEEIIGSVLFFLDSDTAYGNPHLQIKAPIIRLLAVSPKYRGLGVATELIKESVRRARALGEETLHLHTSDMMASAVRLYERLGFVRDFDKEIRDGDHLVKSYKLLLKEAAFV
ncbi:GNAT family N-acetyltransferase [Paenibacillus protaetiae]|uniref:GNAT family N-acetyltransferase n=1 Tax=Paenibacillus protaetiae TaxID=2509456 RepID=A0A4V0YFC0_9BACL|nr:GNAT family N-acetyltransferase [Paenibacillus protaetiae]QAY67181.1 GNAT family N-acetyltransferase [Paenibacillus protaetiae]